MNILTTENLDISYDETLIVKALNLSIHTGEITTIVGPNGCGKSTVLKAIGRILKPSRGCIYLNGDDIRKLSTNDVAKKMAILPQTPIAPSGLTVNELVAYGRFPHQKGFGKLSSEDKNIIQWALESTKLQEYCNREVDTLSGGQRQRVWIAMALAQQTDLILLDEPTTYLDLAHQLEVLTLLQQLNREQQCTIVMVLHDLNLAARFSDYMVAVRSGAVVSQGTPKDVMSKKVLEDTFSIDAHIIADPIHGCPVCVTYNLISNTTTLLEASAI